MPFPLETSRLRLRYFCDEDLETFLAYRNDPEVYKYQGWKVPFERLLALQFIDFMKDAVPGEEDQWFQAALELKATHAFIGDVGFFPKHGQARLGFTLHREYWGQGYAAEAVTAVIEGIFGELRMHRIVADCDSQNVASYRLLERLGFRREGHHLQSYWLGDRWGDEYLYALLESEWRGTRQS